VWRSRTPSEPLGEAAESEDGLVAGSVEAGPSGGPIGGILALGAASGAVALAYEVLWTRELLNALGSTSRASAIVLAAFMSGLALGAWAAGAWSARAARPLWAYVFAETVLAVIGLTFTPLLGALGSEFSAAALSTGALIAILLVPAFLMGVALPVLAAALEATAAPGASTVTSRHVAWLYGVNTVGGAIAAFVVGFGVLPAFGLAASTRGVAATGLAVAAAAALMARRYPPAGIAARGRPKPRRGRPAEAAIVVALVLSGIAALGYEILWTRILVLVVGSSSNAFSLMLGLYLFGIALGALWIGRHGALDRGPQALYRRLQIATAVSALIGVAAFPLLPGAALHGYAWLGTSPVSTVVIAALIAAAVMLPTTMAIGASLPVAARLMERATLRRGYQLGLALALVTAGNVAGVLVTALVLIPAVGLQKGVAVLAGVNLAAAAVLWIAGAGRPVRRAMTAVAAAAAAAVAVAAIPPWDQAVMSSGVFRQAPAYLALLGDPGRLDRAFAAYRTRFYREGSEAVVAVFDRPTLGGAPHRILTIDGKVDASSGADMATQVLSGHLPFVYRPDAERVLVIGLASGVTVGAIAGHPVSEIDVVEIEPAVVGASHAFDDLSGSPLADPRVRVVIDDGRRFLAAGRRGYDVIVSEPSNPWMSMSARLFTREFFRRVKARLTPGGVFVQWLPLYGLSTPLFEAMLRTLLDSFPQLALYRVAEGDLVAIASSEPLTPHPSALMKLFSGRTRAMLERVGVREAVDLMAMALADAPGLGRTLRSGPLNTDDNGLLEFASPWYVMSDTIAGNLSVLDHAAAGAGFVERWVAAWLPREGGIELLQAVAGRWIASGRIALAGRVAAALAARGRPSAADLLSGDIAAATGRSSEAEAAWSRHDGAAFRLRRGRLAARNGDMVTAAPILASVPSGGRSAEDDVLLALALAATGRLDRALETLDSASAAASSTAAVLAPFVRSVLLARTGRAVEAEVGRREVAARLDELRRCLEADGCRETTDSLLAWARTTPPGVSSTAWQDLRQALYLRVTRPLPLYFRGVTRLWLGEDEAAREALATYLKLLPEPDPRSRAHRLIASGLGSS